jgi:hypothetical protein
VAKTRVSELAKRYGITSEQAMEKLAAIGEFAKTASASLDRPAVKNFESAYGKELVLDVSRPSPTPTPLLFQAPPKPHAGAETWAQARSAVPVDATELELEQAYFDNAWEHREASRATGAQLGATEGMGRYDGIALAAQGARYLARLAPPEVEVAHGSIADEDGDVTYIGRNAIFDENGDLLVVNWRAPVGAIYEQATVNDPKGVARKRSFTTDRNTIRRWEDTYFAELAERIAELSDLQIDGVDDTLLADLDSDRSGTMRDIVRTIQASQSALIRHPANALLVIQGGPGTGKSAVALHRASWLLYNEESLRPDRMLIVGPTDTFSNYIKDVLPGLGDVDVPQLSLRRMGPQRSTRREESPEAARIKGGSRMIGLIHRALHLRIRLGGEAPEIVIGRGAAAVALSRAEIEDQIEALRSMPTYNAGRAALRTWFVNRITEIQLEREAFSRSVDVDTSSVDLAVDRIWPPMTAQQFMRELLGSQLRLQEAAGDAFTARDIGLLYRKSSDTMASETWSDSDVALLDEADFRIRGTADRFDHIIVDEAQDLSPMQLRSLRRRSTNGHFTIVGDIAQSTGPWARDSWDQVIKHLAGTQLTSPPVIRKELDYGYRVPAEIYEVAAKLLPIVAPGVEPLTIVRSAPANAVRYLLDNGDFDLTEEVVDAIKEHAVNGRFIGVIAAPDTKAALIPALKAEGLSFSDADSGSLGTSVNIVSATEAKGLEFDAVVVVEPAQIAALGERGMRLLYIALTRATKYLTVVHAQALEPLGLAGAAPLPAPELTFTEQLFRQAAEEGFDEVPDARVPAQAPPSELGAAPFVTRQAVATDEPVSATLPGAAIERTTSEVSPLIRRTAKGLADEIREAMQQDKWAVLVTELARELGIEVDRE